MSNRWQELLDRLDEKSKNTTMQEDGPNVVKLGVFIDAVKACGGPKFNIKQIELLVDAFLSKSENNPPDFYQTKSFLKLRLIRINILGSLRKIEQTKKVFNTYETLNYSADFQKQDEIFVDKHGASANPFATTFKGSQVKSFQKIGELIDVIGIDAKISNEMSKVSNTKG